MYGKIQVSDTGSLGFLFKVGLVLIKKFNDIHVSPSIYIYIDHT